MEAKKLYRSNKDKMIAGVCGGLGQYLSLDPTLIRLLFAVLAIFGVGSSIVLYIILMIVVPLEPDAPAEPPQAAS
jgi:phage shock protein C